MIRNQAGQTVGSQMVDVVTGAAFTGAVTVYVTGDAGTQAIGSVGAGLATNEGNGYYTYRPSLSETDYAMVAFTFVGTGAIPSTVQVATMTLLQAAAVAVATTPGTISVLDLLTGAFAELNVADAQTALAADDAAFALRILNDYLDGLTTQGMTVYTTQRATWTITAGVSSYTIGPGATINVPRPVNPQAIERIGYRDTSAGVYTTEITRPLLTYPEYAGIPIKTLSGTYPTAFYYNPTYGATGYGTIDVFPVPTSSTLQGVIYVPTPVTEFSAVTNTVTLPPGFRRFLRLNLALELASAYQVQIPPGLEERAREARADVKRANTRLDDLMTPWRGGRYDVFSDTFR